MLAPDIIKANTLQGLLSTLQQGSLSTQQVTMFSLGTFCGYPEFRNLLTELNFLQILKDQFANSPDATVQKYLQRIFKAWQS